MLRDPAGRRTLVASLLVHAALLLATASAAERGDGAALQLSRGELGTGPAGNTFELDVAASGSEGPTFGELAAQQAGPSTLTPAVAGDDVEPVLPRPAPTPGLAAAKSPARPSPPPERGEPSPSEPAAPAEPAAPPSALAAVEPMALPRGSGDPPAAAPIGLAATPRQGQAAGGAVATSPGGAGSYGAATGTSDRQELATALTRAIPAAVSADAIWSTLPLGPVGSVELTLELDGDGKLADPPIPPRTAEPLRLVVRRTVALLAAGRFAIAEAARAGRATVRIEVELSQQPALETGGDSLRLSFQAPSAAAPGRACFTLASGRHFEATVAMVERAKRP